MAQATATVEVDEATEGQAPAGTSIVSVFIAKAKASLDVDISKLPDDVYNEVIQKGLQSVLGRGMSEIKTGALEGAELVKAQEAALEVAAANLDKCYKGEIRFMAAKRTKVKGKERTEAMRIAKQIVKDQMKAEGLKISHYSAKEITAAAEQVLADNPEILEQAKENLAKIEEERSKKVKINLKSTMKADPKKVAAAEEKKAAAKAATAAKRKEKRTEARA
jgi:hypothetical protein